MKPTRHTPGMFQLTKMSPAHTLWAVMASGLLSLTSCEAKKEKLTTVTVTHPVVRDVTVSQQYKGQIQSYRHIQVRAFTRGFLEAIPIQEGQLVKMGDLMFHISPELHQLTMEADQAKVKVAESELAVVRKKFENMAVAENEVLKYEARLARAQADLAATELNSAAMKAPFDGVVGSIKFQQGSLVEQGDVLTTLADDSTLWVYFNMPEAGYLEYMALTDEQREHVRANLVLPSGDKFPHEGTIGAIQSNFNKQTGSISFRADFPNPDQERLHGQSATVLISELLENVVVVPQRSVVEILHKRYVFVVTDGSIVRQREVEVEHEFEDLFVVKRGIGIADIILRDGVRMVRDGDQVRIEETDGKQSSTK